MWWLLWIPFILGLSLLLIALRIHLIGVLPKEMVTDKAQDFEDKVNNGDLLFFTGNTFGEKSIRWYHKSYWSHCSFVFRDIDKNTGLDTAFVLESDLGQHHRDGPRVTRLTDKLKNWKGLSIIAWRKYKGSPIKKDDILAIATDYYTQNYTFDRSMYSWFFSNYPESSLYKKTKDPKAMFCSELIADVLQRLNVLDKQYISSWYTPETFYSWNVDIYEDPIHIDFKK